MSDPSFMSGAFALIVGLYGAGFSIVPNLGWGLPRLEWIWNALYAIVIRATTNRSDTRSQSRFDPQEKIGTPSRAMLRFLRHPHADELTDRQSFAAAIWLAISLIGISRVVLWGAQILVL